MYRINCLLEGDPMSFPVHIDQTQTVGDLKDSIKAKNAETLTGVDARNLNLYHLNFKYDESDEQMRTTQVNKALQGLSEQKPLSGLDELSILHTEKGFPKGLVHIFVMLPQRPRRSTDSKYDETGDPVYMTEAGIRSKIERSIPIITSEIKGVYSLIKERRIWLPPGSVKQEVHEFYQQQKIPLFRQNPSLLLHRLDATPNPLSDRLFDDSKVSGSKILCNVSGSGKTRLLFEGLCQKWGFYFVAKRSSDLIGMPDLEHAISIMKDSRGWVKNIFKNNTPQGVQRANDQNEAIAMRILSKVFLARWIVLHTFINVVKDDNQGTLPSDILHDWLLFQLRPTDTPTNPVLTTDPFIHIMMQLSGASPQTLLALLAHYSGCVRAITKFNSFFVIIDEAQVAGEAYMGAFSSGDSKTERPVLRPLVRYFQTQTYLQITKVIVSGTGFSLSLFNEVMGSSVGKVPIPHDVVHSTGDFFERDVQLSYVARYLPPTYLDSESGKHLQTRIRRWLRGRHRFTVSYLEVALIGPWKSDQPASPHKLLNAFVNQMASYIPRDGFKIILDQEEHSVCPAIPTFDWTKLQNDPKLLNDLATSVHTFITRGTPLSCWPEHEALVQYGIARFVDTGRVIKIEEPLALVGILRYFNTMSHTIEGDIRSHLQVNKGLAFEEAVLLTVTRLLDKKTKLRDIFEFRGEIPEWANRSAQILTIHPDDGPLPFSIDHPFDPASIFAYSAKDPESVTHWLKNGQEGWCIPSERMGPDLIVRLLLDDGKILVVVFQAKCYSTGNIDTVSAAVTTKALKSLSPRKFFASLLANNAGATLKQQTRQRIEAMLAAINVGASWIGAEFNILRVVAAFPLAANLGSTSKHVADMLKQDNHPLAILSKELLVEELIARPEGKSYVDQLTRTIKRAREELGEDEADNEGPKYKKVKKKMPTLD